MGFQTWASLTDNLAVKASLDISTLKKEAKKFTEQEALHYESSLYGVTDGKAVGTYFEKKLTEHLGRKYNFQSGSSASGIDFPKLNVDMKITSQQQPQSSCPYKFPEQKIYGLGYHLLIFVYEKTDQEEKKTSNLNIRHTVFLHKNQTADFQMTKGISDILKRHGNIDDIVAFFYERNLPADDIKAEELAKRIINDPPKQGYLTISNALQWRLQYSRVIQQAGNINGIERIK